MRAVRNRTVTAVSSREVPKKKNPRRARAFESHGYHFPSTPSRKKHGNVVSNASREKNLEKIPHSMDAQSGSLVTRADELSPGPGQQRDVLLLYWTLVGDQVLVPGYELQFARLSTSHPTFSLQKVCELFAQVLLLLASRRQILQSSAQSQRKLQIDALVPACFWHHPHVLLSERHHFVTGTLILDLLTRCLPIMNFLVPSDDYSRM